MTTARQWAIAAARAVAAGPVEPPHELSLAGFQDDAARRLAGIIRNWGGALLADAVGMGKTRVALTVAATIAREQRIHGERGDVWLCVPSRLTQAWRSAAALVGLDGVQLVTHAAMSRHRFPPGTPLMLVVDEAHRFRNAKTARRRALTAFTDFPVLLVTATPVANSLDDVWRLLALFIDDTDMRARFGWDLATARDLSKEGRWDATQILREVTVRRTSPPSSSEFGRRPRVALEVAPYSPSNDEQWLWAHLESEIRALHFARAADDWPIGLFVEHVLRRWESGTDALLETVRELRGYVARRIDAARHGRQLDRRTFRELFGEQPAQEVFTFVYPDDGCERLDSALLEEDAERLLGLERRLTAVCTGVEGRDAALLGLAATGERLLVFTSYRAAAKGLFERLSSGLGASGRVGLVTGSGAWATGIGRLPAGEALRRFSPRSHGLELPDHETLQVLVATDCIAEGVNLQDCGRIVLADLPYSPLAVEQRIGRLVRPGGAHEVVRVVLCRPINWNDSLGMRRRLADKLSTAQSVGFAQETSPFAALAALESVAALDEPGADIPRASTLSDTPNAWLVLASVSGHLELSLLGAGSSAATRVAELVWDQSELTPCDVPDSVLAQLAQREQFLRATHAAPAELGLDAPEVAAWRAVVAHAEGFEIERDRLAEVRARLLRRHRAGVRRQLTLLIADPDRLLSYIETLSPPRATPSVELIAALGLDG